MKKKLPEVSQLTIPENSYRLLQKFRDVEGMARHPRPLVVLSVDDVERVQIALAKMAPDKIEMFIRRLDHVCQDYEYFLRQNQAAQSWQKIEDAIPSLKAALKAAKQIEREGAPVQNMESVPGATNRGDHFRSEESSLMAFFECSVLARDAVLALAPLIKHLEELRPPRPRRGRPQKEGGFAQAVADIFQKVFEEPPSKWREGALAQVLTVCLESMGLPAEDPARRLRTIKR